MTTQARELAKLVNNSGDVNLVDDITLGSDGALLNFGADSDVVITHVHNTGLLVNSTRQLQFGDSGTYIHQSADGVLDLVSDTEIELNATTLDINANVDISGTLTVAGALDFGDAVLSNVGAVALDSISGDADANTSITFSGSDVITITTGGETQVTFNNGSILPTTDNDIDLGSSSLQFKDAHFHGTVETDALTIGGTTLAETIADTVGAMVASNTETNIAVTYDDSDNTLDFVVGTLNQNTSGSAVSLANARTIHGVSFNGTADIDLSEPIQDTVGAMFSSNTETGITATYQDGDGTVDLVVGTLNQNTTGTAATVTTAAQSNITSLGTLTTLTVDNIIINGTNIGHTSDTDSIAIASNGVVTFSQIPVLPANSIDSGYYVDGSIDLAHMSVNSIDSDQYVDGSIDTAHIADSQITVAKMAANSVDSAQYVDGSIDTAHYADNSITGAELADNIDIAGTLDVTGATTLDHTLSVAEAATFTEAIIASKSARITQVAITSGSGAVAWDANAAANAYHVTTENTTISAPGNAVEGAIIQVELAQGGTARTIAWNTVFEFAASTAPTVTATASKTDIFTFRYNGSVWQEIGRVQNMAQT